MEIFYINATFLTLKNSAFEKGLHQLNPDVVLDLHQLQDFDFVFGEARYKLPFEAVLMWGTDRQSRLNHIKLTANPRDDFMKQETNTKSGSWQKMMIIPVENTKSGRLSGE